MSDPPLLLISAPPGTPTDDVRAVARAAGFTPVDHTLGSVPAVDFEPLAAAVVLPADRPDAAAAQTRRWRVELGDRYRPIVWLAADPQPGLDAGADVCLPPSVAEPLFAAQIRALRRIRDGVDRLRATAADATAVTERLRKEYDRRDADRNLARTLHRVLTPAQLPAVGPFRLTVQARGPDDFCDAWPAGDDLEFVLSAAADPFGPTVKQLVSAACVRGPAGPLPPGEVLRQVNRALVALGLPDPPLVSAAFVRANPTTGRIAFARAGLPSPVHVPAVGDPRPWVTPGPFLGVCDAEFPMYTSELRPGDRLRFTTGDDGTVIVLERAADPGERGASAP